MVDQKTHETKSEREGKAEAGKRMPTRFFLPRWNWIAWRSAWFPFSPTIIIQVRSYGDYYTVSLDTVDRIILAGCFMMCIKNQDRESWKWSCIILVKPEEWIEEGSHYSLVSAARRKTDRLEIGSVAHSLQVSLTSCCCASNWAQVLLK